MSKFLYSPFNKTYQYLCLQQQVSHRNNLKQVKSTNCSNIKYNNQNKNTRASSYHSLRGSSRHINDPEEDYQFLKPYLVIHKNSRLNSRQNTKRILDNRSLACRLMNASCSIITRDESLDSFRKHQKYQKISSRYDLNGKRKQLLKLNQSNLQFSRVSNSIKQYGKKHKNYYCTLHQKNRWE